VETVIRDMWSVDFHACVKFYSRRYARRPFHELQGKYIYDDCCELDYVLRTLEIFLVVESMKLIKCLFGLVSKWASGYREHESSQTLEFWIIKNYFSKAILLKSTLHTARNRRHNLVLLLLVSRLLMWSFCKVLPHEKNTHE